MLAHNDQRITGKELVFLDAVHFKVDPDSGIGDAIPVEEFRTFDERRLIFESDDVYSQFTDELPESCGFEILLFKKSKITEEDIQGLRDKLFIESFRKHVFHEEVNLIHRVKLLHSHGESRPLNLGHVTPPVRFNILVEKDVVERALLPPVLNSPIKFQIGPIFDVFLVRRLITVLAELAGRLFEIFIASSKMALLDWSE